MNAAPVAVLEVVVSSSAGGGPQHVLTLAGGLRQYGWRPIVVGPPGGALIQRFGDIGVQFLPLPTDRLRPSTLPRLVRLARDLGVRLIHSHGKGAGMYARLAAHRLRLPAVHTFHGIHVDRYGALGRRAYVALERQLSRWTDVVINVSRAQEREGLALGLFTRRQSCVVRNGVDVARLMSSALERQDARRALGVDLHGPLIGCAARFDEVKRLDVVLEAAAIASARVPSLRVVLIGRGREEARLRALTARLELDNRVTFAGEIPDAAHLFRAFDLYCASSRREGAPLSVLEAMALGVPVLASDIPAHRELLGDASRSLVPLAPAAFAGTISALMSDPEARTALGAQQRTRARSEFDVRESVTATAAIYRHVVGM